MRKKMDLSLLAFFSGLYVFLTVSPVKPLRKIFEIEVVDVPE